MCKEKLYVTITLLGRAARCEAAYHPRGCMRARYSHIDIELSRCQVLENVARLFHRGMRLGYRVEERCLHILIPVSPEPLIMCFDDAYPVVEDKYVYVKKTRPGTIYVGPIELLRVKRT